MGLVIRSSAESGAVSLSALALAVDAVNRCLAGAAVEARDLGLLINTGVYRDDNLCEPAVAPLIQQRQGLNLDPVFRDEGPTFSFDLRDGAAGFLAACHAAEAWLADDACRAALVVASDAHPSGQAVDAGSFPFAPAGAALLLEPGPADRGFCHFAFIDGPGGDDGGIRSYVDLTRPGSQRGEITVEIAAGFEDRLLDALTVSLPETAAAAGLDLARCAVVCLQPSPSFRARLARRLALPEEQIVDHSLQRGFIYAAAAGAGLHRFLADPRYGRCDAAVCAMPGAGSSLTLAVYRRLSR